MMRNDIRIHYFENINLKSLGHLKNTKKILEMLINLRILLHGLVIWWVYREARTDAPVSQTEFR
jgi:uncharacterized membrane protein